MPNLFTLQCPTCGAGLQLAGEMNTFFCEHCSNKYLLDRKIEEMNAAERENLQPLSTYTNQVKQWLKVGSYEIYVHVVSDEVIEKQHIFYAEVECRNRLSTPLTCRHDQWIVFDEDGYTYEAAKDFSHPAYYEKNDKRYLGMSRTITQGMRLRGWLAYLLPSAAKVAYLQFSSSGPIQTVAFQVGGR